MTLIGAGSTLGAVVGFAPFVLPAGYLFLHGTQLADFRRRSPSERLLWTVSLGIPLSIVLVTMGERLLSQGATLVMMLLLAMVAAALWVVTAWRERARLLSSPRRTTAWALVLMALLGVYVVLATVPVETGNRIYESVAAADWSVRVPLVDMAIHRGEPLVNPFDGIRDQTPAMRYYYYWYVVCGLVGRAFHLEARPVLTASCVWAAWMLTAVAFLLLKYLAQVRSSVASLRRMCLIALPVSCILGLDLLGIVAEANTQPRLIYPEMDWWRTYSDFSMAFHTAVLYAPHHTVGTGSLFLSFLLLLPPVSTGLLGSQMPTLKRSLVQALAAGLCAAAMVGCSTYMAMFLAVCCLFVVIVCLRRGDRRTPMLMVGAGAFALLLSLPFLREALHTTAHAVGAVNHRYPIRIHPRSAALTKIVMNQGMYALGLHYNLLTNLALRVIMFFGFLGIEAGFFSYVLYLRLRQDWPRRKQLPLIEVAQWSLVLGIGLLALFVNSDPLAGANDLGRHAGLALRVIAVLWTVPLAARFLYSRSFRSGVLRTGSGWLALTAVVLGLSAQVYQVISQRFYLYAVERRWLPPSEFPFPYTSDAAEYYHDLYHGYRTLLRPDVPPGRVLYNPTSYMHSAYMVYQTRFAVAPEPHCMTAFGGDINTCEADMPAIQQLFGGVNGELFYPDSESPYVPSSMTMQAFTDVCRQHHVAAAVVSNVDPVWANKDSFAWHAPVLYATSRVRFLECPRNELSGAVQP